MKKIPLMITSILILPYQSFAIEKRSVHFSWPVKHFESKKHQAFTTQSHRYQITTNADNIEKGVKFNTRTANAVIKIMSKNQSHSLHIEKMMLTLPNKKRIHLDPYKGHHSTRQSQLIAPFFDGANLVFNNKPLKQKGAFMLSSAAPVTKGKYIIDVYEKDEPPFASLTLNKKNYVQGEKVTLNYQFQPQTNNMKNGKISAYLTSPNGNRFPINIKHAMNNVLQIEELDEKDTVPGVPWHITITQTNNDNGNEVEYRVDSAFSYAKQVGQLQSNLEYEFVQHALHIKATIISHEASRYALEGTLYGFCEGDKIASPFLQAQSANWLEKGEQHLTLIFDAKYLIQTDCHGPFTLKNIRLIDQQQLKPIDEHENLIIAKI